jgi:DNA-binding transcriptional LysR family regulator
MCKVAQVLSADDFRYFLALAQRGRLTLAATQLGVDHTTVGRRVTALERAVGQRLFDRTPDGWHLTEGGRKLLGPAEMVATAMAQAEDLAGRRGSTLTGTVRVVCPDGFGAFLFAPAAGRLHDVHPDLTVELLTATAHVAQTVREFDVGVTVEKPSSQRVLRRHLTDYHIRLYATREYLESHPPLRSAEDLDRHVVVWYIDHLLDVPNLRLLHQLLPSPANVQSTNLVVHWQAAAAGVAVAPLPQYIAAQDPRLVPVLPEISFLGTYWIALPPEHARLARVQAVVKLLEDVVRERVDDLVGPART